MGNHVNKISSDSTEFIPVQQHIGQAVEDGDTMAVSLLLDDYPKWLNAPAGNLDNTLLHIAVLSAKMNEQYGTKMVELLVDRGADIHAKNRMGQTPLHLAVGPNAALVEFLLQKGAEVNAEDNQGNTPLALVAYPNNRKPAELLLQYGADVNTFSYRITINGNKVDRKSPLMTAVQDHNTEFAKLLLQNGADIRHIEMSIIIAIDMLELLRRYPPNNYRINERRQEVFVRARVLKELWGLLQNEPSVEGKKQEQVAANPNGFFKSYLQWLPQKMLENTLSLAILQNKKPFSP